MLVPRAVQSGEMGRQWQHTAGRRAEGRKIGGKRTARTWVVEAKSECRGGQIADDGRNDYASALVVATCLHEQKQLPPATPSQSFGHRSRMRCLCDERTNRRMGKRLGNRWNG